VAKAEGLMDGAGCRATRGHRRRQRRPTSDRNHKVTNLGPTAW